MLRSRKKRAFIATATNMCFLKTHLPHSPSDTWYLYSLFCKT